jgi:DNA-nicking Smr family endonuclease
MLTDEEKALWAAINRTTRKIKHNMANLDKPVSSSALKKRIRENISKEVFIDLNLHGIGVGNLKKRGTFGVELIKVQKNVVIEATIDLHGSTQLHAEGLIKRFLCSSQVLGKHWVRIITGKSGVLFQVVPEFLKKNAEFVSGYMYAKDSDGGKGVIYVRIRVIGHNRDDLVR